MKPTIVASHNRHAESVAVPKVAIKDSNSKTVPGTKHAILTRCEIDSMSVFRAKGVCSTSPHAEMTSTARALFTLNRWPHRGGSHTSTLKRAFSNEAHFLVGQSCVRACVVCFQPINQSTNHNIIMHSPQQKSHLFGNNELIFQSSSATCRYRIYSNQLRPPPHKSTMQLLKLILTSLLFVAPVAATDAKGTLWLKEKSEEKDVVATGSGLLYKVGFSSSVRLLTK